MTVKQLIDELNAVPEELLDSEITYRHCFEGDMLKSSVVNKEER